MVQFVILSLEVTVYVTNNLPKSFLQLALVQVLIKVRQPDHE